MASKKLVIRGGLDLNSVLSSGGSDPVLTRNPTTKEVGETTPLLIGLPTTLLQGYIYIGDNTNTAQARLPIGDINLTDLGLVTINDGVITDNKVSPTAGIAYSKLNLVNSIVDADIATAAAIVRSKLASGSANRVVVTNSSGVMIDANSITPNRVLISDSNGIPTDSGLTTTVLGYVDPTSSIQTQLNNRLSFSSSITPNEGDIVVFQSGVWNSFPRGSSGQYLTSTVGGLAWTTTPNGLPVGGVGNEILRKIDATDYNTEWHTLVIADLTDITANAAQVNELATGYYDATSSIQTQFSLKLNNALANNAMFVGNSANQVSQLAPGSNGQVLTIVAGVPQWQTVSGTGTVTSVAFSGGSTGLSVTGSPITTSGTITLTGTLGTANGGTNITSYTTGDLPYASSSTVLSKLGIGTNGYVLTVSGGLPSWQPNVATTPLTTKGDIFIYSTTNDRLPVGTDGYHLTADSTDPTGLKWTAPVFNPFSDLNPILYNNADPTKLARLDVSSVTTGTTRVYTLPDFNGTIALLGSTNGAALSKADDTNVTLTLSAGSGTALLNATTITVGWTGTLADGRIASSANWNTAYNRSGTSLGFTSSTFTFTKQDASTLTVAVPTFNQNTTGSAAKWTTARNLAGNSVDGSADVAFTNKFIVQGTVDSGLSGAQFLGSLATGIVKNTTTTGVLSIAVAGDFPTLNQNTTGSAATLTTTRNIAITGDGTWNVNFNGSADVTAALTLSTVNSNVGTFGSATKSVTATVNGKGLVTTITEQTVTPAVGSITGLGTGVATWLATPSSANLAAAITDETGTGALVFAGSPVFTGTPTLGTLSYSDTGILWSWQSNINSYNQVILQNTNSGAAASANYIVSNDAGTSSTHYGEFGMNSSGFTGSGSFNIANAVYLDAQSDDLVIGTVGNKTLHFVTNNSTTDNLSITGAGVITATSNVNGSAWNSTWTATANSQSALAFNPIITSRSIASDVIYGISLTGSITAASTNIAPSTFYVNTPFKTSSGITTGTGGLQNGSSVGISKSTTGMTAATYTNVAPASTSGSGTGALFTVIVSGATTFTSFNCTTSGSGYSVGDTVTFNGSQFGSGSGSIVLAVISTVNSFGSTAYPITIVAPITEYAGITTPILNTTSLIDGSSIFSVTSTSTSNGVGLNTRFLSFSDANGTIFVTGGQGSTSIAFSRAISATSFTGSVSTSSLTATNLSTFSGANYSFGGAQTAFASFTGSTLAISSSGGVRSYINGTGGVTTGLPSTYTISAGGSGYTAGNKAGTGGTGSGAVIAITVSGGAIATATPVYGTSVGTGYTVGDVLTVSGGTGGTVTVATVDQFGGFLALIADNRVLTDAKSNNNYVSYFSNPTYTLTSSSASTWFGYYNPTYTSFGTGTKGGICIVPTGTVSGIGTSSPNGTLHIVGSGSIPTLKTVGVGTGTNYSYRAFQSDGTTPILNLQDNGNFSIPVVASLSGFGTSSQTSTLESGGSLGAKTSSLSADTTLDATYFTVRVDASGANRTITLPTASGCTGRIYVILKSDSSANTVTISTTAGGNKVINTQYSGYMVQSNGTSYNVISSF